MGLVFCMPFYSFLVLSLSSCLLKKRKLHGFRFNLAGILCSFTKVEVCTHHFSLRIEKMWILAVVLSNCHALCLFTAFKVSMLEYFLLLWTFDGVLKLLVL